MDKQKIEKAVNNIQVAISQFKGTLADHKQLQDDMKMVVELINKALDNEEQSKQS